MNNNLTVKGNWHMECRDKNGNLKWVEDFGNAVVTTGLQYIIDNAISGATLYIGLTDSTPTPSADDTMASHAGWAEVTTYDEANRVTWGQARSSQSVTNSSSADVTLSGNATVGGAFLTTDNTKGGTSETLISVGAFTEGDRSGVEGDSISITYTITLAAA